MTLLSVLDEHMDPPRTAPIRQDTTPLLPETINHPKRLYTIKGQQAENRT